MLRFGTILLAVMADRRYTLHTVEAGGDEVAVRYEVRWRQVGDFFGLPADGLALTGRG